MLIYLYLSFVIIKVSLYSRNIHSVAVLNFHILSHREMSPEWTAVAVCLLAGMVPLARAIQVTGKSSSTTSVDLSRHGF